MIDISLETFESEVITASQKTPVLVSFGAPQCESCRTLSPILEALETTYAGRFILAKIDLEQNVQLASMFGVRSVPANILMIDGQPVDGFMGAMPESQICEFLAKHLGAAPEAIAPEEQAVQLSFEEQLAKLAQTLQEQPSDENTRFDYIKLLLQSNQVPQAREAFTPLREQAATSKRFSAIAAWFAAWDKLQNNTNLQQYMQSLDSAIESDKRNFNVRFERAQILFAQQQWTKTMDELLEILMRDKNWEEGQARVAYIHVLELMQQGHPANVAEGQIPVEDPVLVSYRRRLSSVILS